MAGRRIKEVLSYLLTDKRMISLGSGKLNSGGSHGQRGILWVGVKKKKTGKRWGGSSPWG